ncbi:MAG: cation:proton antiporter, partial [Deltaproteobacteria bacterium]
MENVTLALALLLCAGFAAAKIGQYFRLPSVTGYIVAGLLLGPSGLGIITSTTTGHRLEHFTQIALMLIAFGIGEHLELKRMQYAARRLVAICIGETASSFVLVYFGTRLVGQSLGIGGSSWLAGDFLICALFLGAISIATAPASILHVLREMEAAGPMTSLLLQTVALNNALAIIAYSLVAATAGQLLNSGGQTLLPIAVAGSFSRIFLSLLLGIGTGLLLDLVSHRLRNRGELLTTGLSLLLLTGEGARLLALSPLLAGMATGFTIVNRDHRDVRLFRVINAFEPPIYVLFFTLAGADLNISMLSTAGWLGFTYFLLRAAGKYAGASLGARLSGAAASIGKYLGMALLPQAGVAIGLVFLLSGEPAFHKYSAVLTPVVLAAVLLAEIIGPVVTRIAVEKAGETAGAIESHKSVTKEKSGKEKEQHLVPWSWEKLVPSKSPVGTVVFGASRSKTVGGLARIAVLLAHYYKARPLAVRVVPPDSEGEICAIDHSLFLIEDREAASLGYELGTSVIRDANVPEALATAAEQTDARAIVLGYPMGGSHQEMERVLGRVAAKVSCPVVIVRFIGVLHTERILVPVVDSRELPALADILAALAGVGRHRITL